jgi:hypothetical protein
VVPRQGRLARRLGVGPPPGRLGNAFETVGRIAVIHKNFYERGFMCYMNCLD